ncbi:hypothetical protein BGP_1391 [Beggiatoa sp. PS]|nr:hypothetical protein BGP_1391 [Beggiatoa sp. PS]
MQCEPLLKHREALGLPQQPKLPLHLTIGNMKITQSIKNVRNRRIKR